MRKEKKMIIVGISLVLALTAGSLAYIATHQSLPRYSKHEVIRLK